MIVGVLLWYFLCLSIPEGQTDNKYPYNLIASMAVSLIYYSYFPPQNGCIHKISTNKESSMEFLHFTSRFKNLWGNTRGLSLAIFWSLCALGHGQWYLLLGVPLRRNQFLGLLPIQPQQPQRSYFCFWVLTWVGMLCFALLVSSAGLQALLRLP